MVFCNLACEDTLRLILEALKPYPDPILLAYFATGVVFWGTGFFFWYLKLVDELYSEYGFCGSIPRLIGIIVGCIGPFLLFNIK